jgi:NAD(P) transhydrogenase subunit beta
VLTTLALIVKLKGEGATPPVASATSLVAPAWSSAAASAPAGKQRRDDQDAGTGGGHALADRPGGRVHRGGRRGRAAGAGHLRPWQAIPVGNRMELFIGAFVGAITFSGSVIAFGKLSGKYKFRLFQGAPVSFAGQHMLNLLLAWPWSAWASLRADISWLPFIIMAAIAFVLGVLIIIPIGGADMPVVVSMLNSYSGWAAAGIGFSLNNSMLIIAGSLVGSSGAILSYIMCKAMNRSFFNVILGGFGGEAAPRGGGAAAAPVKSGSADDAAFLMGNAET